MAKMTSGSAARASLAREIAAIGQRFHARGWAFGTSGNYSAVLGHDPLRLLITPSAAHKGQLTGRECLEIDGNGGVIGVAGGRPSAETPLHLAIASARQAGAILHTHSVWSTILSDHRAGAGGLNIEGYEMLKGLEDVASHEHREWIPILANDQDMSRLAVVVRSMLAREAGSHAFLLRGHGLYTWGATLGAAERHVEILEFLLEAVGRRMTLGDAVAVSPPPQPIEPAPRTHRKGSFQWPL